MFVSERFVLETRNSVMDSLQRTFCKNMKQRTDLSAAEPQTMLCL